MIHKGMLILDILQQYPQTREVFARYGMPCDRCMGAVHGSLADGARMHDVPLEVLIRELEAVSSSPTTKEGWGHLQAHGGEAE